MRFKRLEDWLLSHGRDLDENIFVSEHVDCLGVPKDIETEEVICLSAKLLGELIALLNHQGHHSKVKAQLCIELQRSLSLRTEMGKFLDEAYVHTPPTLYLIGRQYDLGHWHESYQLRIRSEELPECLRSDLFVPMYLCSRSVEAEEEEWEDYNRALWLYSLPPVKPR